MSISGLIAPELFAADLCLLELLIILDDGTWSIDLLKDVVIVSLTDELSSYPCVKFLLCSSKISVNGIILTNMSLNRSTMYRTIVSSLSNRKMLASTSTLRK